MRIAILVAICGLVSAGCSFGGGGLVTPTRSSEEVLRTAEAAAQLTRQAMTPTFSPTPVTPSPTTPSETATPVSTSTPTSPVVTANMTANVRSGPDATYDWIDFLFQGQTGNVVGRYENPVDGTWWYIGRIGGGFDGWVWGGVVTLSGDVSGVPFLIPPPSPTPGPSPTPSPTSTPST